MTIRYVMLTDEQRVAADCMRPNEAIGVALTDANECVSIASFRWDQRGSLCDNCTGHCSTGGSWVWTKKEYQSQGIFTELWYWLKNEAGIDRAYVLSQGPFGRLLADRFELVIPNNYDDSAVKPNTYETSLDAQALADRVSAVFQA